MQHGIYIVSFGNMQMAMIGKMLSDYYLAGGRHVVGVSRSDSTIAHERYTHLEQSHVCRANQSHGMLDAKPR